MLRCSIREDFLLVFVIEITYILYYIPDINQSQCYTQLSEFLVREVVAFEVLAGYSARWCI